MNRHLSYLPKLLAVALIVLSTACSSLKPTADRPTLNFEGIRIRDLSFNAATFTVRFEVVNPNRFDVRLDRVTYTLQLNDRQIGTGDLSERIEIEGRNKKSVELPIKIKYIDIVRATREITENQHSRFILAGTVKSGPHELKFNEVGELDMPFAIR